MEIIREFMTAFNYSPSWTWMLNLRSIYIIVFCYNYYQNKKPSTMALI